MMVGVANVKMGFSIPVHHEHSASHKFGSVSYLHMEKMLEEQVRYTLSMRKGFL